MSPSERYVSSPHRAAVLMLGFKYLAWLNGLGLLLVLSCALGIIATDFSPDWLRLPLVAFSCGVLFCALGLIWAFLVQVSLYNQAVTGYVRRTHWVPLTCTIIAYCLSLMAFLAGCWLVVYLAGASYQASDADADESQSWSQSWSGASGPEALASLLRGGGPPLQRECQAALRPTSRVPYPVL